MIGSPIRLLAWNKHNFLGAGGCEGGWDRSKGVDEMMHRMPLREGQRFAFSVAGGVLKGSVTAAALHPTSVQIPRGSFSL